MSVMDQIKTPQDFSAIATICLSVVTVLLSFLAVRISRNQYTIAREKLRLDLYDRRFEIYLNALNLYQALYNDSDFDSIFRVFIKSYRESQFLFSSESGVYETLGGMKDKASQINGFRKHGHEIKDSPKDLMAWHLKAEEARIWFEEDGLKKLEKQIKVYLDFHKITQ